MKEKPNPKNPGAEQLRAAAEAKLARAIGPRDEASELPGDEILHELQVHQIELEMQNKELRRSHLALEAARDRYADLYDFAPVGYITLNREGLINDINLTGAALLGVDRAKLSLRRFSKFVSPPDADRWHRLFMNMMQRAEAISQALELEIVHADSSTLHVQINCLRRTGADEVPLLHLTLTDIGKAKQVEELLRDHDARLQAIFDTTVDGIIVINRLGIVETFNPAAERIFGYSAAEVIGHNINMLMPEPYRSQHDGYLERYLTTGEAHVIGIGREVVGQRKDGSTFPLELALSRMQLGKGIFFTGIVRDITNKKQAEQKLLSSEERLKLATASGQIAIWEVNLKTNKLTWDDNCFTLYKMDPEKFTGTFEEWAERLHPDDLAATVAAFQVAAGSGSNYDTEFRIICPDGELRYIKARGQLVRDKDGNPERMIGTNWDNRSYAITQRQLTLAHAAINKSRAPFLWLNSEGAVIDVNEAACQRLGYSREELFGMYVWNFNVNLSAESWHEHWAKYKQSEIRTFETSYRRRDGSIFPVEITGSYIAAYGEEYIFAYVQNITERKMSEADLRLAAVAFETHEAIMITDADTNIIRVNRAFEKITGYRSKEVLGKNPRILRSDRHDQDFYAQMWQQLLETGSWSGEIWDKHKDGHIYPTWMTTSAVKDDAGATTHYVGTFADITEWKQAEEKIKTLAFNDVLTGLPNRRLLQDRLNLAVLASARSNLNDALLYLDLDNFKTLNDSLGHEYGDALLIEVAQRLKLCVREADTVARLGGDEFIVLIENISEDKEEASLNVALVAEKIRATLATPYHIKEKILHSTPSIGVCMFCDHDISADDLLKHADIAMYQAKSSGRNKTRFFDPKLQHAVESRAALESDLRSALADHQLQLYYQVQVDSDGLPMGAEALVRWIHPERGMVSPADFIPIAEESSLILDIGHWVLDTVCRQIAAWHQHEQAGHLVLAVNISARQFVQQDFVEQIAAMLQKYGIDPARLKLELTESVVLDDLDFVIAKMLALKNTVGVTLSLDDFGTGYSSLSYLKRLPLDQIKIDQSFVRDMRTDSSDAVMVKTIIDLARNFDLHIIAEGVETDTQLAFLKQHNCMAYQGYLFSKPVRSRNSRNCWTSRRGGDARRYLMPGSVRLGSLPNVCYWEP